MNSNRDYRYLLSSIDKVIDYILNFAVCYLFYLLTRVLYPATFKVSTVRAFFIVAVLCLITSFLYNYYNVYLPMRTRKPIFFIGRIFLVTLEVTGLSVVLILLLHEADVRPYVSWLTLSAGASLIVMYAKKIAMISFLRNLRSNNRKSLVPIK